MKVGAKVRTIFQLTKFFFILGLYVRPYRTALGGVKITTAILSGGEADAKDKKDHTQPRTRTVAIRKAAGALAGGVSPPKAGRPDKRRSGRKRIAFNYLWT